MSAIYTPVNLKEAIRNLNSLPRHAGNRDKITCFKYQ